MVHAAERDRKLVADLAAERAGLREPKMMGVCGLPPADKAGLQGDELQVRLVAIAPHFADRQHALVDAVSGVATRTHERVRILSSNVAVRFGRVTNLARRVHSPDVGGALPRNGRGAHRGLDSERPQISLRRETGE